MYFHADAYASLHSSNKHGKKTGNSIRRTRLSETACRVRGGLKRAMLIVPFPRLSAQEKAEPPEQVTRHQPHTSVLCVPHQQQHQSFPCFVFFPFYIRCWHYLVSFNDPFPNFCLHYSPWTFSFNAKMRGG